MIKFHLSIKGKNKIIQNLSFTINKNDFIIISGLSGLGKTTFIDLLSGLLKPTKGQIKLITQFYQNTQIGKRMLVMCLSCLCIRQFYQR